MHIFSCSSWATQTDLRSEGSRYMSRHLDQPSITIGNQRTQFYQFQQDLVAHKQPAFSLPSTPQPPPSPRPSQFQQVCGVDPTRPCSDQASATCCVTSAKGLSLPLKVIKGKVNHLSFITSPYSPNFVFFPTSLSSYSTTQIRLHQRPLGETVCSPQSAVESSKETDI